MTQLVPNDTREIGSYVHVRVSVVIYVWLRQEEAL